MVPRLEEQLYSDSSDPNAMLEIATLVRICRFLRLVTDTASLSFRKALPVHVLTTQRASKALLSIGLFPLRLSPCNLPLHVIRRLTEGLTTKGLAFCCAQQDLTGTMLSKP